MFTKKIIVRSFLLLFAVIVSSCKQSETTASDEEGIIEFSAAAVDEKHPLYGLAPNSATLKIEETNETKKIIGLKAHKIKVTMANDPTVTFDAWYTKELGMEDCNSLNPYAQIKGVLLDYRVKKMGMEMHFVATSRKQVEVSETAFEIPSTMKLVCKEELAKVFTN